MTVLAVEAFGGQFQAMRRTATALFPAGRWLVLSVVGFLAFVAATRPVVAQPQKPEVTISGFQPLPDVPVVQPGPPREVQSLIKSLSATDAMLEVIVGQGRLLTLNLDIVAAGKPKPLIAIGDPSVIAAELVGLRQIRIVGERIGVTDLAITTPGGDTYTLEVRVVVDLDVLRAQLKALFPRDKLRAEFPNLEDLKLYQIRDHLVVEGMASDEIEREHIIETIRAYLESVRTSQSRRIRAESATSAIPGAAERVPPRQREAAAAQVPDRDVIPEAQKLDIDARVTEPQIINLLRIADPPKPPDPLILLDAKLKEAFPSASLELEWIVDHVVIRGEARDAIQVTQILQAVSGFLESLPQFATGDGEQRPGALVADRALRKIVNLIRVPGPQQVLLKVEVAELNRSAMRQLGVSWFFNDKITFIASNVSGAFSPFTRAEGERIFPSFVNQTTTLAGIRATGSNEFEYWIDALRRNSLLKILAEPNLVAMNGHEASFLAGGEFPVPVPQAAGVGAQAVITIDYKKFGVRLGFVPTILDGDRVRLVIDPEVSSIDFDLGIELNGFRVPGLNSRQAHTVVELRQGQTLAIAGLMQLDLAASTKRIPGLGDLPVIGAFFSNNTGERIEKELIVLVTPYFVEPMDPCQVPPRPGDEVNEPNDLEFYLLGRIESRTGNDFRSTTQWDDPFHCVEQMKLEREYMRGPCGFSR